jgi:CRISPR-associated protein Csd1
MSWIQKLYDTYENCQSHVGEAEDENLQPLMPIYHMTQQAQIEVVIDTYGCWRTAKVIDNKSERTTLIPCTESSAARTSKPVPHPLFDNLTYLAGDYIKYRDLKEERYQEYIAQLEAWCNSPYAHPKVCAVLKYLKKGCLMKDLIDKGVLYWDEEGNLPERWNGDKNNTPLIFKAVTGDQASAFVRFQVVPADGSEDLQSRIWKDPSVWKSYIDYQNSLPREEDFCYVLGKKIPISKLSPKYIRRPGDGAKLISANDSYGFTYRGRFDTSSQAYCIGRETTEKAHNALKWLIPRQAYINGDQVILAWRTDGRKTLDPCKNSVDTMDFFESDEPIVTTGENFAQKFRHALAGYGGKLKGGEQACVIGLDSATSGRLSIFYYRELPEKDLVERIAFWHGTCQWRFREVPTKNKFEKGAKAVPFIGAPSPETIAGAAYGKQINDKLKKSTVQRLLPCIVDKAALPQDIMRCVVQRASNPMGLDEQDHGRTLAVACALVRKYHNDKENPRITKLQEYKERWKMALDTQETDRNYLFGRALAYAQMLENYALNLQSKKQSGGAEQTQEEKRSTNAERLQTAFSQHPARTWKTLHESLSPYLERLGQRGARYRDELNEVISKIPIKDFTNEPLNEIYLLGYACQMQKFREDREARQNKNMVTDQKGDEEE